MVTVGAVLWKRYAEFVFYLNGVLTDCLVSLCECYICGRHQVYIAFGAIGLFFGEIVDAFSDCINCNVGFFCNFF